MADLDRDLGRLEGRTGSVEQRLDRIEEIMADVQATLQQAQGGWRMLMVVGTACAAMGSGLTAVWAWVTGKH